jgi:glutamate synthase domain-containing protein 2
MFTTGICLTGAGVALATTLGSIMYGVMTAGLIMMGFGARRMHHHKQD